MKTKCLVVMGLFLWAGLAFAQAPADSSKTYKTPSVFPRFKLKGLPENNYFKWRSPDKNSQEALKQLTKPKAKLPEDVTPFYSNMPMATFKKNSEPMPSVKADSTLHYHLLKKRYKVMPIPTEEEGIIK